MARSRGRVRAASVVAGGLVLLLLAAGGVACSSEGDGGGLTAGGGDTEELDVEPSRTSSPFTVGRPPEGHRLVQAGVGNYRQEWGSDLFGTEEPVTVLAPPGEGVDSRDAVWVGTTGFAGYQGGLSQASYGYVDHLEEVEVDGKPAVYAAARTEDGAEVPADLVVEVGDDLAVRVSRWEADLDELSEIARGVETAPDTLAAPVVPDPPAGLEVVGSADADVGPALAYPPSPSSSDLPAGERAHVAVFTAAPDGEAWTPEQGVVKVVTLPGEALDLPAAGAALMSLGVAPDQVAVEDRPVGGRPGVVIELEATLRAVATYSDSGDLVLVVAMAEDPDDVVAAEELAEVAASVEAADADEWDAVVDEAGGGTELRADDGATELERGADDGVEWLFQAREDTGDGSLDDGGWSSDDPDTEGEILVDPCLKLGDGRRACAWQGGGNGNHIVHHRPPGGDDGDVTFTGFVIVMTISPAETVRITTPDGQELTAPLHELHGGERRGGVLIVDEDIPTPRCPDAAGFRPDDSTLAYLAADGTELPCTDQG